MTTNQEGMTLGGYRVISQIGKGGMATVYKAYQTSMERDVALKVLPRFHAQDPNFTKRFIQEAHIIAKLEHKNILPVYDFGEDDGVTYMAMRYLNSGTLQDILSLGTLSFADAIEIMQQICAGLDYAHRNDVVHRDIKPANVMIDNEGVVYLSDFGLAKALESSSELTATGTVMGTPLYMAPEQSMGNKIDRRSDIYSAGVVLYEMVTGQPPFEAETPMAVVLAHIHNPLPLPQVINPRLPIEIQRVILKAMAKEPDNRFQSAKEMAEALTEIMHLLEIDANAKTLQLKAEKVREHLESEIILPTDENFTPVSTKIKIQVAETPPSSSKKLIINGAIAFILAVTAIFFSISFFNKSTNEPSQSTKRISAPILYDDFNNPEYDGKINTRIWKSEIESACSVTQKEGELIISNKIVDYDMDECDLTVGQPEKVRITDLENIEAKMLFASEYKGKEAGQSIMFNAELPNGDYWYGLCGAELADNELVANFWVARINSSDETIKEYYSSAEIKADTWHTYRLESNAATGVFSCFMDNVLIGSTTLDDYKELSFTRGLTAWRGPNAFAITKTDDFRLIP